MKKPGRPSLSEEMKKTKVYYVGFTESEHDDIEVFLQPRAMTFNKLARLLVLKAIEFDKQSITSPAEDVP